VDYVQRTISLSDAREEKWLSLWDRWTWLFICAAIALLIVWFVNPPQLLRRQSTDNDDLPFWKRLLVSTWPIGRLVYGTAIILLTAYTVLLVDTIYRVPFNGGVVSDILRRPWLPAEEVSLAGRVDPLVGYTLSTSDGWHVLLVDQTRQIMYIRSIDVAARAVCHVKPTEPPKQPLIELVGANTYPTDTCFSNAGNQE